MLLNFYRDILIFLLECKIILLGHFVLLGKVSEVLYNYYESGLVFSSLNLKLQKGSVRSSRFGFDTYTIILVDKDDYILKRGHFYCNDSLP